VELISQSVLLALGILFDPANLVLLFGAVLAGILVGVIPGLTSSVALGLLLPLTFTVDKDTAFILLLGIYCGATYGGSIPAILMNLPGTPTAAVTAVEGYPMAKRGEGSRALGIAALSSTTGGLFSCIILILLSLQLSQVALLFAGPEYFALCVFALVVVVVVSSQSIVKGFLACGMGLLISTIGLDPVNPTPRFTFGIPEILIGIPEVPATIGLFCVAEAYRLLGQPAVVAAYLQSKTSGFILAVREIPKLWRTWLRSSVIGTFIGILPGTGAVMASFFAYGDARRRSKERERFGKGAPEGVCASESANNAVTGGALVPLLTLGIPGDVNTLMLLGAMFVHGLVPGPTLFIQESQLVFVIFGSMILANLFILPIGLYLSTYIARAALLPAQFIVPIILILSITGPAMGYGHIYYFWIAIVFGLLGYVLSRGGFPVLAVAMTLILGPILERNFRFSLMLSDTGYWIFLTRPISLGLLLLALVALVFGLRREILARRREEMEALNVNVEGEK